MKGFLLILVSVLTLTSCGDGNVTLDNARAESVTFAIDGENHRVDANSRKKIQLDPGNHTAQIALTNGEAIGEKAFDLKEGGVLHAGGSEYIIWRQLYGLQSNRKDLLNEEWLKLDSLKVFGDFKQFPEDFFFIEKTWDHDLEDEFPESQSLYITSDFSIESKIFREDELIDTYRSLSQRNND